MVGKGRLWELRGRNSCRCIVKRKGKATLKGIATDMRGEYLPLKGEKRKNRTERTSFSLKRKREEGAFYKWEKMLFELTPQNRHSSTHLVFEYSPVLRGEA